MELRTAERFRNHGKPRLADTIQEQGTDWLRRMQNMVEQWATEIPVDISDCLAFDLRTYVATPPASPVAVDIVVPFYSGDFPFVTECVASMVAQEHTQSIIHVVSDGAGWPPGLCQHGNVVRYETGGGWGPYRIANALVPHCRTDWLALQDADDTSRPDRIWWQVETADYFGAPMISSAAKNWLDPGSVDNEALQKRLASEYVIRPGSSYHSVPLGRCVNSTRTMRVEWFRDINGFSDQFCTGDFQFDNRTRFAGVDVVDDQTIRADRRLHNNSLTGGPFKMGSRKRTEDVALTLHAVSEMRARPTMDTARRLGGLDHARDLQPSN